MAGMVGALMGGWCGMLDSLESRSQWGPQLGEMYRRTAQLFGGLSTRKPAGIDSHLNILVMLKANFLPKHLHHTPRCCSEGKTGEEFVRVLTIPHN